ncbi:hypothetical protein KAX17_11890 [Candidatus Bipolaricaulota bacterium]|nr:hypothetical protein [Candidatus Bipolaricaulota bacterium]
MSKKVFVLGCALVLSFSCLANGPVERFLDLYSGGNIHTFLRADVFETLRTLGEEPSDYALHSRTTYSADYQFTYVDTEEDAVVSGLVVIYGHGHRFLIDEVRLVFSGSLTIDEMLSMLGYSHSWFDEWETEPIVLGDKPYETEIAIKKDVVTKGLNSPRDAEFQFFLDHFDGSVRMLFVSWG